MSRGGFAGASETSVLAVILAITAGVLLGAGQTKGAAGVGAVALALLLFDVVATLRRRKRRREE